jgi:glucose-6-phosphate isomerase
MHFNPGFNLAPTVEPLGFRYGDDCYGPEPELRTLAQIRKSLKDPTCNGPEIVYAIVMDVGKKSHRKVLNARMLLYGAVTYAAGSLGKEPVRSQGHIHKISAHSGWSPPEVYEIWAGKAVIYMQETAKDNPGRCFAVYASEGDVVVVPPGWAHATISADPGQPLTFGAWCDREYGFEYEDVRAHGGLAWYPLLTEKNQLVWERNIFYMPDADLIEKGPGDYHLLGLKKGKSIYNLFEEDNDLFQFVSQPYLKEKEWQKFIP